LRNKSVSETTSILKDSNFSKLPPLWLPVKKFLATFGSNQDWIHKIGSVFNQLSSQIMIYNFDRGLKQRAKTLWNDKNFDVYLDPQRNPHLQFPLFWIQISLKFRENSMKFCHALWKSTLKNNCPLFPFELNLQLQIHCHHVSSLLDFHRTTYPNNALFEHAIWSFVRAFLEMISVEFSFPLWKFEKMWIDARLLQFQTSIKGFWVETFPSIPKCIQISQLF
jgi:hypothetical protein